MKTYSFNGHWTSRAWYLLWFLGMKQPMAIPTFRGLHSKKDPCNYWLYHQIFQVPKMEESYVRLMQGKTQPKNGQKEGHLHFKYRKFLVKSVELPSPELTYPFPSQHFWVDDFPVFPLGGIYMDSFSGGYPKILWVTSYITWKVYGTVPTYWFVFTLC